MSQPGNYSRAWPQALYRSFSVIAFDWDGTAVPDRQTPVPRLIRLLDALLNEGVVGVVITGTNVQNLMAQGLSNLSYGSKRNLYLCTNRGSETYSFDSKGMLQLVDQRVATKEENRLLDQCAEALVDWLRKHGLESEIIYSRMNRRKIDIIPASADSRWADPKKSEFRELAEAVDERLKSGRISGGLREVLDQTLKICGDLGLHDPKITSDLKHVEIGLTDKADAACWVRDRVAKSRNLGGSEVAFFGDEFGSLGGMTGSDSLMKLAEEPGFQPLFVSVGVEPEGVPKGVVALGGGPNRFSEFLEHQLRLRHGVRSSFIGDRLETREPDWKVEQEGFDPSSEREMETLFAISNGFVGVRGGTIMPIPASQPDLFVAGIYSKKVGSRPYSELEFLAQERPHLDSEIVSFPFPFRLDLTQAQAKFQGRRRFIAGSPEMRSHERTLDLKKGFVIERFAFQDELGRMIRVRSLVCASLADPHLLLQEIVIDTEVPGVEAQFSIYEPMLHLNHGHLRAHFPMPSPSSPRMSLESALYETSASRLFVSMVAKNWVNESERALPFARLEGHTTRIRRAIAVCSSRECGDPLEMACRRVQQLSWGGFETELNKHIRAWGAHWEVSDIRFEGAPELSQAQRFNGYHLRSALPARSYTSVPARALVGRAYEGHVFWDSEVFILPFALFNDPKLARNLLEYRHCTLPGARARAREQGCQGASYAWESTVTGEDVTPTQITLWKENVTVPIFTGSQQIHVTADIAWGVWQYWNTTGDDEFLIRYGAEILIETCRFWGSRATSRRGRFHILKVIGPDEYHNSVDDNAFTNWMARFNLEKGVEVVSRLQREHRSEYERLAKTLRFNPREIEHWKTVATKLYIPEPDRNGVIEQFAGFFSLKGVEVGARFQTPVHRLLDWEGVNGSKRIKQADTLMIPFLFPDVWPEEILRANFLYYEPLTDHGSSLSPSVHAAIAGQLGLAEIAKGYWDTSLNLDLSNLMRNTSLGIHLACMGGTWQSLVLHSLGVSFSNSGAKPGVRAIPHWMPEGCSAIDFKLIFRGDVHSFRAEVPRLMKGPEKGEVA